MTYQQVKDVFDKAKNIFGDTIYNFKVKSGDHEYDFYSLNSETDAKFTRFSFEFKDKFELECKNNVNFWNVNANDSFKTTKDIKSSIVKSDGNNNTADTYVKTTDSGYDGTLTWIVMVTMDKNATKYTKCYCKVKIQ